MIQLEGKASKVSELVTDLDNQQDAIGVLAELETHLKALEDRASVLESKTN